MSAREARERETCCHRRLCNAHGAWKAVGHARVTRSPFCKEVSGRGNRLLLPALAHHAQARRLGSSTSSSTASGSAMPHALITDARRQSQARTVPVSAFHHSPRARGSCVPEGHVIVQLEIRGFQRFGSGSFSVNQQSSWSEIIIFEFRIGCKLTEKRVET